MILLMALLLSLSPVFSQTPANEVQKPPDTKTGGWRSGTLIRGDKLMMLCLVGEPQPMLQLYKVQTRDRVILAYNFDRKQKTKFKVGDRVEFRYLPGAWDRKDFVLRAHGKELYLHVLGPIPEEKTQTQ